MHGRAGLALRTPVLRHTAASAGEHHSPAAVPAPVPTPVPTPVLTCTAARSHQRSHICAHTSLLNCNPSLRPVAGDNNQTSLCPPEKAAEAWGRNRLNLHRPGPVPPPTPLPPPCSAPGLQEGLPAPLRLLGSPVLRPSPRARVSVPRIAARARLPSPRPGASPGALHCAGLAALAGGLGRGESAGQGPGPASQWPRWPGVVSAALSTAGRPLPPL